MEFANSILEWRFHLKGGTSGIVVKMDNRTELELSNLIEAVAQKEDKIFESAPLAYKRFATFADWLLVMGGLRPQPIIHLSEKPGMNKNSMSFGEF